jgi:hypothetical protein
VPAVFGLRVNFASFYRFTHHLLLFSLSSPHYPPPARPRATTCHPTSRDPIPPAPPQHLVADNPLLPSGGRRDADPCWCEHARTCSPHMQPRVAVSARTPCMISTPTPPCVRPLPCYAAAHHCLNMCGSSLVQFDSVKGAEAAMSTALSLCFSCKPSARRPGPLLHPGVRGHARPQHGHPAAHHRGKLARPTLLAARLAACMPLRLA